MIQEYHFQCICDLTTSVLGLHKGSLSHKSRKQDLNIARQVAAYIGLKEEGIHPKTIAEGLKRDRSLIYHYKKNHKKNYATSNVYRNCFNKLYKAYKDIHGTKDVFFDNDLMKQHLLKNGVIETLKPEVLLEIKSGQSICVIKTSYFQFSNQLENVKFALKNYHFTINIK